MNRSFASPLIGAALLVAMVVAAGAAPRQQATGVLTGVVTDSSNGRPLAGVAVSLRGASGGSTTKGDGRYTITGIAPGSATLVIQQDGYVPQTLAQLNISAGQTVRRNVSLQQQGRGILTGLVRDSADQHPISGARVMIQGTALTASTANDGKYTITGISSGTATLVVQRTGYIAEAFGGIRITDGQTTTRDVSLRAASPGAFRVIPIGPTSAPIAAGAR